MKESDNERLLAKLEEFEKKEADLRAEKVSLKTLLCYRHSIFFLSIFRRNAIAFRTIGIG